MFFLRTIKVFLFNPFVTLHGRKYNGALFDSLYGLVVQETFSNHQIQNTELFASRDITNESIVSIQVLKLSSVSNSELPGYEFEVGGATVLEIPIQMNRSVVAVGLGLHECVRYKATEIASSLQPAVIHQC